MLRFGSKSIASLLLVAFLGCKPPATQNDRIQILEDNPKAIGLFVPASDLLMIVPKRDLASKKMAVGGSTESPRYFYLSNPDSSVILSGWFEPASRFTSAKQIWETDSKRWAGKPGIEAQNAKADRISSWEATFYITRLGSIARSHARAHWVQDGTWIDLHLSMAVTSTEAAAEKQARAFLASIAVKNVRTKS